MVDLSCGSGLMARRLAKSRRFGRVVAVDYSESMLQARPAPATPAASSGGTACKEGRGTGCARRLNARPDEREGRPVPTHRGLGPGALEAAPGSRVCAVAGSRLQAPKAPPTPALPPPPPPSPRHV